MLHPAPAQFLSKECAHATFALVPQPLPLQHKLPWPQSWIHTRKRGRSCCSVFELSLPHLIVQKLTPHCVQAYTCLRTSSLTLAHASVGAQHGCLEGDAQAELILSLLCTCQAKCQLTPPCLRCYRSSPAWMSTRRCSSASQQYQSAHNHQARAPAQTPLPVLP